MWYISDLKKRAREVLKRSYWKAFLVSLIITFIGGNSSNFNFRWAFGDSNNSVRINDTGAVVSTDYIDTFWLGAIITVVIVVALLIFAFRVFVGYALEVGGRKFFVDASKGEADLNQIGFSFKRDRYINIIGTMFMRSLFNFLWFLLLIIPGIVKHYAYRMVPYILADNPNIGYKRAIELSNEMTRGSKFKMWLLDLSFIGWFILGVLALFIGVFFVLPYVNGTAAELYLELRKNALERGLCNPKELNLAEEL